MASEPGSEHLDPDAVGRREFTRNRRGFDQIEVRAFLNSVAAELRAARQREVELSRRLAEAEKRATRTESADAKRMTTVLGEETARIIEAARSAGEEMRQRAEAESAEVVEAANRRLDEAKAESEKLLEAAREDAVATRDQATTEAMAEVEQAKDRARQMVEEARAHRERVMADASKRRTAMRAQYQALVAIRDQAVEHLDASQSRLGEAIAEARHALSDHVEIDSEGESEGEPDDDDETSELGGPVGAVDELDATDEAEDDRVFRRLRTPAPPARDATEEVTPESVSDADTVTVDEGTPVGDPETVEPEPGDAVATSPDQASPGDQEDVDLLFAKLRAESGDDGPGDDSEIATDIESGAPASIDVDGEVDVRDGAEADESDDEPGPADPLAEPFKARDEVLAPLDRSLQRKLKRVLADDQNEVLDRLRTVKGRPTVERIFEGLDDVALVTSAAVSDDLAAAYHLGGSHLGVDDPGGEPADLVGVIESHVAEPLRSSVGRLLDESDDVDELSETVRSVYRAFRSEQLPGVSSHLLAASYARGRYDAIDTGAAVVWLQDPDASSPDCEDNELAGVVEKGTVFPTGSECAPAYEGCRCLVIPAAMAPERAEA